MKVVEAEHSISVRNPISAFFSGNKVKISLTGAAVVCLRCGAGFMATSNPPYESIFLQKAPEESRAPKIVAPERSSKRRRSNIPDPDLDIGQPD